MLASTPTTDYISLRARATRDHSLSPSCRAMATPPSDKTRSFYDSPMLTPSPLRSQRPLFSQQVSSSDFSDPEDIFLQSPYRSPSARRGYRLKPGPVPIEDEEGGIFLSTTPAPPSSYFPPSTSQPLRTPVKQIHRASSRSALSAKPVNVTSKPAPISTLTAAGTKRKSTPNTYSTPLRQRTFTPLPISHPKDTGGPSSVAFDRLAPLPAPRFTIRTPQTKLDTEVHLRRHTESMTRLRICDLDDCDSDDSGCEVDKEERIGSLFSSKSNESLKRRSPSDDTGRKLSIDSLLANKGRSEVVEDVSPGGHINKRRARSRPVSQELLESVNQTPSPKNDVHKHKATPIIFPTLNMRQRTLSNATNSSELGSPLPRRRVSGATRVLTRSPEKPALSRAPLTRITSGSSTSNFFGPSITPVLNMSACKRISSSTAAKNAARPFTLRKPQPSASNRHSYAGTGLTTFPWGAARSPSPSPGSSPSFPQGDSVMSDLDGEEDTFFGGPPDTSFVFSVTEGTPSPRSKQAGPGYLPVKFKPRDSGVVLSDYEDEQTMSSGFLNVMPSASTSVGSMNSDDGDTELVTPIFPSSSSGWPQAVVVRGVDDAADRSGYGRRDGGMDVDAFIMRTLAAGGKPGEGDGPKKVPGTPVKKIKTAIHRPWQSAVAAKVSGFGFGPAGEDVAPGGKKKIPRKSLPAAFPALGARKASGAGLLDTSDTDDEDDLNSPSARKDGRYAGVGLGKPGGPKQWLMRRSSSGAFSSGSETNNTPTRLKAKNPHLPPLHIAQNLHKLSPPERSATGSSGLTPISPTAVPRRPPYTMHRRSGSDPRGDRGDRPGRFERDFVEVDEVGSGEFGRVTKVRYKHGREGELFAVKKSKRFEGVRHRLRLREEVDILQHLTKVARGPHPNVLAYMDSWEQDDALFIQTELCELGNFARFLWEYGRAFPRLDEARVWKIFADLSNGLRFIHDAGVIHLDLKPANIFVTGQGRFKIGDFGMASLWPRPKVDGVLGQGGIEREGDKNYLAPEVLQGQYGKAADMFSFGVIMLETATNIVVPDQGDAWHRLRQEDFIQIDLDGSPELFALIRSMMRAEPRERVDISVVYEHRVVSRARVEMERTARVSGTASFTGSPLAGVHETFLDEILCRGEDYMDMSP